MNGLRRIAFVKYTGAWPKLRVCRCFLIEEIIDLALRGNVVDLKPSDGSDVRVRSTRGASKVRSLNAEDLGIGDISTFIAYSVYAVKGLQKLLSIVRGASVGKGPGEDALYKVRPTEGLGVRFYA